MKTEEQTHDTDRQGSFSITVDNEDDGRRLTIHVGGGETVQRAIDDLYKQLGRAQSPQDRLRCAGGNQDVLPFARTKVKDYKEHCPSLHWLFAGPTGGAAK